MTNTMLRDWWPDAIERLTRIGHDPDRAHGALLILFLLEAAGLRVVMRSDFTVEIEAPGHLASLVWDGSEADRHIRAWWPVLANAVRARDSVRGDEDDKHLGEKIITAGELVREYSPEPEEPTAEDIREWYRQKARERDSS